MVFFLKDLFVLAQTVMILTKWTKQELKKRTDLTLNSRTELKIKKNQLDHDMLVS